VLRTGRQSGRGGHSAFSLTGAGIDAFPTTGPTSDEQQSKSAAKVPGECASARSPAPERVLLLVCAKRLRRESLESLLRARLPDLQIVAVADPRPSATWSDASPAVALIDASTPPAVERPLGEAIVEVLAVAPNARLLILSDDAMAIDAVAAARASIAGAFPISGGAPLLVAAIELALAGGCFEFEPRLWRDAQEPGGDSTRRPALGQASDTRVAAAKGEEAP
jgi:DNA-binding NarL/FixJ family response regulator